ncbi:MAG: hypothetical protein HQ582_29110, partial [Planctomycetes bacterium]|nr:hypothetical protein [Planctomycetota bacterium]
SKRPPTPPHRAKHTGPEEVVEEVVVEVAVDEGPAPDPKWLSENLAPSMGPRPVTRSSDRRHRLTLTNAMMPCMFPWPPPAATAEDPLHRGSAFVDAPVPFKAPYRRFSTDQPRGPARPIPSDAPQLA